MNESFCNRFCEVFHCSREQFAERVLWQCMFPQAVLPARLLWQVDREYFGPDLELIEQVGELTDMADVRAELSDFHYHHPSRGLWRRVLKVRVSGQRLVGLADRLLTETSRAGRAERPETTAQRGRIMSTA